MIRQFAAAAVLLSLTTAGQAQQDFSKVQIRTQMLSPGVAVLFGEGGNIGVSYGPDGTIVIDDQYAPLTERILTAARALDPRPVRFVLNTHFHFDHTGGNESLGKAGAVIVAHDNVRARLSAEHFMSAFNRRFPPSPAAALPIVTFSEGVTFHVNGDTLRVEHVAPAHTDGDSMVKWEKANVLHTGDVFVRYGLPFIDLDSGGSIDGLIAAADRILALSDANTRIIPGHGEVAGRADVEAFKAMLVDIRGKVAAEMAKGRTVEQIKAAGFAKPYAKDGFVKPDQFVEIVYKSLSAPAKGHRH